MICVAAIFLRASLLFTVLNSFLSNDYCSLVTWQMLLLGPFLFAHKLRKARGVILVSSTPQIRSLVTKLSKMAVFSLSDPSKFSGVPLVLLSKSPFKLNIEIKVS